MFYMEQAQDLKSYVNGLASIKTTKNKWSPFDKLVMGRPALGMPGDRYNYHEDVAEAVATLAADAAQAKRQAQCWCIWDTVTNTGPPGSMLKLKRNESSLS